MSSQRTETTKDFSENVLSSECTRTRTVFEALVLIRLGTVQTICTHRNWTCSVSTSSHSWPDWRMVPPKLGFGIVTICCDQLENMNSHTTSGRRGLTSRNSHGISWTLFTQYLYRKWGARTRRSPSDGRGVERGCLLTQLAENT
jgi:hypothetical protein